jgi:glycosyltransferase involved in cell wall biosynthesis
MFEYMACGRAIVSSDLPVIREILSQSTALFCPPEEPSAWSDALGSLIDNPERRVELGTRARQAVLEYTWKARAQKALDGFLR